MPPKAITRGKKKPTQENEPKIIDIETAALKKPVSVKKVADNIATSDILEPRAKRTRGKVVSYYEEPATPKEATAKTNKKRLPKLKVEDTHEKEQLPTKTKKASVNKKSTALDEVVNNGVNTSTHKLKERAKKTDPKDILSDDLIATATLSDNITTRKKPTRAKNESNVSGKRNNIEQKKSSANKRSDQKQEKDSDELPMVDKITENKRKKQKKVDEQKSYDTLSIVEIKKLESTKTTRKHQIKKLDEEVPQKKYKGQKAVESVMETDTIESISKNDINVVANENIVQTKSESLSKTCSEYSFKISSWNVAGLRAFVKKGGMEYFEKEKPDVICLQEIKCTPDLIPTEAKLKGYHSYWHCFPGGHNGVGILSKTMPYNIEYGIGNEEQDKCARIITAEYMNFYIICVYVPNSGRKLVNLDNRLKWNQLFQEYLTSLHEKKPVIICGDLNVSHAEIDLANPKTNKRSAGFTQEERNGMSDLLALGYIDTFRDLYPDKIGAYTYWTYMMNARAKNIGWRLDYFITSEKLVPKVADNVIRSDIMGSDHCPIELYLNL